MGFMTPFMILNDGIHLLNDKKNQKKFCEDLYSAACELSKRSTTISIDNFCNPATALRSQHADISRILYCGQNSFFDIFDCMKNLTIDSNLTFYESAAKEAMVQGKILLKKIKELKEEKIAIEGKL